MAKLFKDFYGCSASIIECRDGSVKLTVRTSFGKLIHKKSHRNFRAARSAMSRLSDGWEEVK